jgi:uncharacterized protein
MIHQVDSDIWFDSERVNIISGRHNYNAYVDNPEKYPALIATHSKSVRPINIVFLSSIACNLRCSYCYASQGSYGGISECITFTAEKYIYTYETFINIYGTIKSISFFGGEPLLGFQEIRSFVEYLFSKSGGNSIPHLSINSNGTIMNSEIRDFLKKYNVHFSTSLDGPKYLNDIVRYGNNILSVHDEVYKSLFYIKNIAHIRRALQFTYSRMHIENYKSGDIVTWLSEFEALPIDWYEMIAVTTEDAASKIDLTDSSIVARYELFCNDIADHCLSLIADGSTTVVPNIFSTMILMIAKRRAATCCDAGHSITVSPDLMVYPCHVVANNRKRGVQLNENYIKGIMENEFFQQMLSLERKNVPECSSCIAHNLCGVFCKGMTLENGYKIQPERCFFMKAILAKTIRFMATEYKDNADAIKKSLIDIVRRHNIL